MRRCHVPPDLLTRDRVTLEGEAYHYLIHVLRLRKGDPVLLCDGRGGQARAVIERLDRRRVEVVMEQRLAHPPPQVRVRLFQGLPKQSSWEWILQKTTELGVSEIFPVRCARSVPRLEERSLESRVRRWRRIVKEASLQSERAYFPVVHAPISWREALREASGTAVLFWARESRRPLWEVLGDREAETVDLFVGPEGGFTDEELEQARECGIPTATLGETVLRAETAAVVATALVFYELRRNEA